MPRPLTGYDAIRAHTNNDADARIKRRTTFINIVKDEMSGNTIKRVEVPGGWLYVLNGNTMQFVPNTADCIDIGSDYDHLNEKDDIF